MSDKQRIELIALSTIVFGGSMKMTGETDHDGNPIMWRETNSVSPGHHFWAEPSMAESLCSGPRPAAARVGTPEAEAVKVRTGGRPQQ